MSRKVTIVIAMVCAGLLVNANAYGQPSVWKATDSNAWNVGNNWLPAGIPIGTTDVRFDGTALDLSADLGGTGGSANVLEFTAGGHTIFGTGVLSLSDSLVNSAGQNTISAAISGASTGIIVSGSGSRLTLSGDNSLMTGPASVGAGAELYLATNTSGGTGAITLGGGKLRLAENLFKPTISEALIGPAGTPAWAPSVASYTEVDGVYTLSEDGSHDIWNNDDGFYFVYTQMSGDLDLVVDVTDMALAPDGWTKAGIVVRQDLTSGSRNVAMVVSRDNGVNLQRRLDAGGACQGDWNNRDAEWDRVASLRLVRSGDDFTAYYKHVGDPDWILIPGTLPVVQDLGGADVYVGLGLTSHSDSAAAQAVYENVSFFAPIGSMAYGNDVIVTAAGSNIEVEGGYPAEMGTLTVNPSAGVTIEGAGTSWGAVTMGAGSSLDAASNMTGTSLGISGSVSVGVRTNFTADLGPVSDGGSAATLHKIGGGLLDMTDPNNVVGNTALRIEAGRVSAAVKDGISSLQGASITLANGILRLGSGAPDPADAIATTGTVLDDVGPGTVTCQSGKITGTEAAEDAFDDRVGAFDDKWYDSQGAPNWVQYQYDDGAQYALTEVIIWLGNDTPGRDFKRWRLVGSNDDGANWDVVDATYWDTDFPTGARLEQKNTPITTSKGYNIYRIEVDQLYDGAQNLQVAEIEFMGVEGAVFAATYGHDILVEAGTSSGIEVVNQEAASLGVLTMQADAALSLDGSLEFTSTTFAGDGEIDPLGGTSSLGVIAKPAGAFVLTVDGTDGVLRMDANDRGGLDTQTELLVKGGTVAIEHDGVNTGIGAAFVTLNGGSLALAGPASPATADYGFTLNVLGSGIIVSGDVTVGATTLDDGASLDVSGAGQLRIPLLEIGSGGGAVSMSTTDNADVFITSYSDNVAWAQNTTFEIAAGGGGGGGRVIFDGLTVSNNDSNTLFDITGGSLIVLNDNPAAGVYRSGLEDAAFQLNGGRLGYIATDGKGQALTNALTVTSAGGTLYNGSAGGLGGGAMALKLTAPLEIPSGATMSFETDTGYTIDSNGQILNGAGGLTTIGSGTLVLGGGTDANYTGQTTVNGGTLMLQGTVLDVTSGIDVLQGSLIAIGLVNISGDVYVGPTVAFMDAYTPVMVGNVTSEGSSIFRNLLMVSGSTIVNGGSTVAHGAMTTGLLRANDGAFTANSTLAVTGAVDANGGTIRAMNTLSAAEILVHNSGVLEATGVITLTTGDGNDITLNNGGILRTKGGSALSTLPDFSVGAQGRLCLAVPQTGGIPVITVLTGGLIDGRMDGAVYSGPGRNVVFQNNAVYGGIPGNDPNTNDLGPLPPTGVRLMRAIIGGSTGEIIPVGDDENPATITDIYNGASYGPWTGAQFIGRIYSGVESRPFEVALNGRTVTLGSTAKLDTTDTTTGVSFIGPGHLTIASPIDGNATVFSRIGDGTQVNQQILLLNNRSVAAGETYRVGGGGEVKLATNDSLDSNTSGLTLLSGGYLDLRTDERRPNKGTFNIGQGAIVRIHDRDNRFNQPAADAKWTWENGSNIIFRKENVDMIGLNWPTNALYIFDEEGSCNTWDNTHPFLISNGGGWIGRQGGNTGFDGTGTHGGPQAALGAVVGDTVTIAVPFNPDNAGNRDERSFWIRDAFDLRFQEDANYALNLIVGSDGPMTTVIGNGNATLVDTLMTGRLNVECSFLVGDLYQKSGFIRFDMGRTDTTRVGDLVQTLRIDDFWGGGGYDDSYGAHEGADVDFARIDNFNTGGQRSIQGKIYWHGETFWVDNDSYFMNAFQTSDPNQMFAEEVCIGSASRFTFAYDRDSTVVPWGTARTIYQPFRMQAADGNTPHYGWNIRPRRSGGSGSDNPYLPNVTLEEGSVLAAATQNGRLGFSFTFEGSAATVRRDNDANYADDTQDWWWVNEARVAPGFGPEVTWTLGELNQSQHRLDIYGQVGDGNGTINMHLLNGEIRMLYGANIVDTWAEAGWGDGNNGNSNIIMGGYAQHANIFRLYVADSGVSGVTNVNKYAGTITIMPGGRTGADDYDALIRPERRGGGSDGSECAEHGRVVIMGGAKLRTERGIDQLLIDNLELYDGDAILDLRTETRVGAFDGNGHTVEVLNNSFEVYGPGPFVNGTLDMTNSNFNDLRFYYGMDGSPYAPGSDATFLIGGDNLVRININESDDGTPQWPVVNEVTAIIRVADGQTAYVRSDEDRIYRGNGLGGTQNDGVAIARNIQLGEGSFVRVQCEDNAYMVTDIHLDGNARWENENNGDRVWLGNITSATGLGTLTIEGDDETTLLGSTDVDIVWDHRHRAWFMSQTSNPDTGDWAGVPHDVLGGEAGPVKDIGYADGFKLNGHTFTVIANNASNNTDIYVWEDIGSGTINMTDPSLDNDNEINFYYGSRSAMGDPAPYSGNLVLNVGEYARVTGRVLRGLDGNGHPHVNVIPTEIHVYNTDGDINTPDVRFYHCRTDWADPGGQWGLIDWKNIHLHDGTTIEAHHWEADGVYNFVLDGNSQMLDTPDSVNSHDAVHFANFSGNGQFTYSEDDRIRLIGSLSPGVTFVDNGAGNNTYLDSQANPRLELNGGDMGYGEGFQLNGGTYKITSANRWFYLNVDPSDANGGTIELAGRVHQWDNCLIITYGHEGKTWGDPNARILMQDGRGLRVEMDDAPAGDPAKVNVINMTLEVAAGATGTVRPRHQDGEEQLSLADGRIGGGVDGQVVFNHVKLNDASTLRMYYWDGVKITAGGTVIGDANIGAYDDADDNRYLADWTGSGTLTVTGNRHMHVIGRIACGGFRADGDENNEDVIFDSGSVLAAGHVYFDVTDTEVRFSNGSTIDAGTVDFNGQPVFFYDGMNATMQTANFNIDPGFSNNMVLDLTTANFNTAMTFPASTTMMIGTGNFNVAGALTSPGSVDIDLGVVKAELTIDDTIVGGDEHWDVRNGGHLIAQGVGALDGATALLEMKGGLAEVQVDSSVAIPAAVKATGIGGEPVLHVTGASSNETVTFSSLALEDATDNPEISISSDNGYDVAFGSTTLDSADRGQVNAITSGTDVNLGPVTITHGTLSMDAVAGATITVGPLDSGGDASARLEFGRGGAYTGGGLVISESDPTKWNGTIYVDSATLRIDANFDGYDQGYNPTDPNNPSIIVGDLSKTIGTRAITEVTYDSSVEGMTMHEYATLGLKLSNTMKDVVAPMGLAYIWGLGDYGLIGGNLILNSDDIDASFRQSDGAGGSMNMTLIEDGWARVGYAGVYFTHATGIMSTLEDANYGAPLDLVGTIILGDPEGAGEDFEISGLIVDGYSPIEDMLWDYYGELMPGKLIKVGDEAVTLSRANTFTGGVDANEGTLVMADTLALGDITGPGLRLQGGTLRIAVADANFDAAAGGYAFSMTDDSTVEVNAAGANLKAVDLDNGTLVINNQMVGATAPSAGPGADARTVINVPDVSIDYVVGLQGTLDVPASATIHNIEDFGASDANTLFQIGAGQTLTIDGDETLDDNRIWNVVGGATLLYSGDLTTAFTLRKAGAGTFTLAGANNSIASLVIGTSPGGTVIVTAAGKVPDSVLIEAGSLYTVQKGDHDYDEVAAASAGIAALSSGSNANVNFSDNTAYLGAVADSTYSGDLTPSAAGYFLGGGGARLTVDDLLTNAAGPNTPATLGWADSHDNNVLFTEGVVLLNAENTLTGDVQVHMETIYLQKAFELVEPTDGNWIYVNPGGTLDLNNTGAREDNIMMNGGGLANTGGTLDANKMFPGPTGDYIIGSNSAGKTSWVDGGFVRANASLWKIGSDTAVLLDPIGGGDSNNTYAADVVADPNVVRGHTTIVGGTLEIYNPTSLAYSGDLNIQNGSTLIMRDGGSLDANVSLLGTIEVQNGGTLTLVDPNKAFALQDGVSSFIGPGATLDLGAGSYRHFGGGHNEAASRFLYLGPDTTLKSAYHDLQDGALIIGEHATAHFTSTGTIVYRRLGKMYRGATFQIDQDVIHPYDNDPLSIMFAVDPCTGSVPTMEDPYRVGGAGNYYNQSAGGNGVLLTPVLSDGSSPTAYIEKFGTGSFTIGGPSYQPGQVTAAADVFADHGRARKFYWLVNEGTVAVAPGGESDDSTLGATAYTWLNPNATGGGAALDTNIGHAHLEGVKVASGAAFHWYGTQGFLPESLWLANGGTDEDGNGFNPGEFSFASGSTLGGVGAGLTLGFTQVGGALDGQTFLCYPTVVGAKADRTLGLTGTINLRSGIEVAGGGTVKLAVTNGNIDLSADLLGALPLDGTVTEMELVNSTVTVRKDHASMTATSVDADSELAFDTGTTTAYNGTVFNDGLVNVAPNSIADLGTTVITSSAHQGAYWACGLFGGSVQGNMGMAANPNNFGLVLGAQGMLRDDTLRNAHWQAPRGDGTGNGPGDTTLIYTGQIWLDSNTAFVEQNDDNTLLVIDGMTILNDNNWSNPVAGVFEVTTPGWYDFEARFSNGGGGYGFTGQGDANWAAVDFGFGMDTTDPNVTNPSTDPRDYVYPEDVCTMSLFRAWYQPVIGRIHVDANATMSLGGFTDADLVTIDGNMNINGTEVSTAHELVINGTGKLDLADGTISPATNGTITGTLLSNGGLVRFENLTIDGSPTIDLGTGLLRATNATVNSDFAFGLGIKSSFNNLAVNANVAIVPGGEVSVSSMATVNSGGKLSLNGGDAASIVAVTIDGGELEITDGTTGVNSAMAIHNDGLVHVTNSTTVDLTDTVITSSGVAPQLIIGQDVGSPGQAGSYTEANGDYTITGGGNDIWGTSDNFYFVYTEWTGDFDVSVDTTGFTGGTDGWRKAGIMAREELTGGSRNVMMLVSYENGVNLQRRATADTDCQGDWNNRAVEWDLVASLRLVRVGDEFTAYYKHVGDPPESWMALGPLTQDLGGDTVYLGLAVTAHNDGQLTTALFEDPDFFAVPAKITVDAGSKLMVGGFTDSGIVTPAGTLELHNPLVTSTAERVDIPDGGVMDIRASSLDANYGSLSGSLLGDGTGLARFRTRLTVEDAAAPLIALNGGQLQAPGEMLVKKDNFAFDGGMTADIGTLNMEGPLTVKIESTGNVSADQINIAEEQTLVLRGGQTNIDAIENANLIKAEVGDNDLSDAVVHSSGLPVYENGLRASVFQPTPDDETPLNLDGATYEWSLTRVFTGDKVDTVLTMTELSGGNFILMGDVNGWGEWPLGSPGDHFSSVISGTFIPKLDGSYNFHWNNDDRGLGYIDVDNDGVFNDTDRIAGYAWNSNGNKVLVAGRQYNFIYMAQEHAGGDNIWFAYTPPGGGEAVVNPTTQAGEWMIRTGAEVFGDIEVVSGAKLSLKGFTNAGEVTIGAGATLALGAYDSNCQDLKLDPMGLLDVGQSLFIMSDPDITLAGVIGDIQTGRNGGGWDGANWVGGNWNGTTGITSSTLIGHELEWSLVAFDPNRFNSDEEVVIRLTIIGDVDIDCDVDEDDRAIMEANFGQAGGWGDGDVDYSGVVDFRDYLLWKAFQGQDYTGPGAVPEPATLVLLAFGGVAILARRRRRK